MSYGQIKIDVMSLNGLKKVDKEKGMLMKDIL
jgi:hypothetical protein